MARIRTVKPEFFRNYKLYQAEKDSGLPLRIAFEALWTVADREGRFKWIPEELKIDCLPYDDVDFSRVLDALSTRGYIVKYESDGSHFGHIPSFLEHQVINPRERPSTLPIPNENNTLTREPRVDDACTERTVHARGERKGKEGIKTVEEDLRSSSPVLDLVSSPEDQEKELVSVKKLESKTAGAQAFDAYALAYEARYHVKPVANAKVRGMFANLVKRLGDDAADVAAFYPTHNSALYNRSGHAVDLLLRDCEKLRTEWITGLRITEAGARQQDRASTTAQAAAELIREGREYALRG